MRNVEKKWGKKMENRNKTCKVLGCNNKARCRGFCNYHYEQIHSHREVTNGKSVYVRHIIVEE